MFWSIFERLCADKGVSANAACLQMNLSNATATHWKQGSWPRQSTLEKIADYFGYTAEEIVAMKGEKRANEKKAASGKERESAHDRAFDCIKYRVGREDAEFMFEAAEIPIEDSKYEIPTKVLKWIAAHCDVNEQYFYFPGEVEMRECDGTPYYVEQPENLEELLKDPDIEMLENKYLKAKYDKYAEIASKKLWKSDNKLQQEIYQGFMELINQFDGDIGSQFALLDRARQAAKQLSEEVALRKERA